MKGKIKTPGLMISEDLKWTRRDYSYAAMSAIKKKNPDNKSYQDLLVEWTRRDSNPEPSDP